MTKILIDSTKNPVIVSMIEPVGGHGGNEFYDFGLCEALGKYCDVNFYTCTETSLHEKYNLKTKTYKFYKDIYGDSSMVIRGVRYFWGVVKTIIHTQKVHADIAHIHIYHFAWREFFVVFLCKIFFIKVVATIHDVESFSTNSDKLSTSLRFVKFSPFIDRYIVHSRYAYESLCGISRETIRNKVHIVPHGDTDFLYKDNLEKQDARNKLAIPAGGKILLFFGQIKKVKGLDILIDAFADLSKEDPAYHLLIVGRPWKIDGQRITDKISDLKISHRVTLNMSYVNNEDVPIYFVAADLVVLPYLKIYSSGVLLRAMHYRTPVVVSDLPPLTDIVHDGENGRVFRAGDSEHLKMVIRDVMNAPLLLKKYTAAGKKTIDEKYSWDIVARETMAVYKSI
jgi:D-inositol-3-phosphate glycosyltransferase